MEGLRTRLTEWVISVILKINDNVTVGLPLGQDPPDVYHGDQFRYDHGDQFNHRDQLKKVDQFEAVDADRDSSLRVGSLIELPSSHVGSSPLYGTIKWIGLLPNVEGRIAGIELVRSFVSL